MLTLKQKEDLINLINKNSDIDLDLIAFEFDITEEEMEDYKKEAQKRKEAEEKKQEMPKAERTKKKDKKKKKLKNIEPEEIVMETEETEPQEVEEIIEKDYDSIIELTKQMITENQNSPKRSQSFDLNKRNFLAYTYFSAGDIESAKKELEALITEYQSMVAYQQMIYIEKAQGNLEDAKFWAYEAMEHHPDNTNLMKQLIQVAEQSGEWSEAIETAKKLQKIDPRESENQNLIKRLQKRKEKQEGFEI